MKTYLIAWNPKQSTWDNLPEKAAKLRRGERVTTRWSCGVNKNPQIGDRVFQIRLGIEPRGIFGSGKVIKEPYFDIHWKKEKAAKGELALYIEVELDTLLDPEAEPILPYDKLMLPPLSKMHWSTQISGILIHDEIAIELEKLWLVYQNLPPLKIPEEVENQQGLFEGATKQITVNAYERNPIARQKCLAYYGPICSVCGFNFSMKYGEIGNGYIHVHHLISLSKVGKEYQVDPVNDLRPVCPNCHAMLHKTEPAMSIDALKDLLQ